MKPLEFVGSSLDDLREFPAEARRAAGFELGFVQRGLAPSDWKPMKAVGAGVREIRIHVLGEWRVLYVAKFAESVYVLHAFQKKTQKTTREDIELARTRYRQIGDWRSEMKKKTTKSSGNVFVDLGFDPAEAAVLQMRANLMSDLRLYIEKQKLTQAQAAKRLDIAQSRVSDLVRGKWDKFSLEMLITLEARLGRTVRVECAA
jgi:phage-related protein